MFSLTFRSVFSPTLRTASVTASVLPPYCLRTASVTAFFPENIPVLIRQLHPATAAMPHTSRLTCNACSEILPTSAFACNRNGTRLPTCRACRSSSRTGAPSGAREQRRLQLQQPPDFSLVLSQPRETSYCSVCRRHRPLSDFRTNRIGAPYNTCLECSAVGPCCYVYDSN